MIWFIKRKTSPGMIALCFTGVGLFSLRLSYLPIVCFVCLLLPVYVYDFGRGELVKIVAAWVVFLCLLQGYRQLNGVLSDKPPAFLYSDGLFLLAVASPLVDADLISPTFATRELRVALMLILSAFFHL